MNGISVLIKKTSQAPSPLPPCEDTARSLQSATRKRTLTRAQTGWHRDLRLPASRTLRNKCVYTSHEVYGILLWQLDWTKIISLKAPKWKFIKGLQRKLYYKTEIKRDPGKIPFGDRNTKMMFAEYRFLKQCGC